MPRASRVRRPPALRVLGLALGLACGAGAGDAVAQSMQTVSISAAPASSTSPDNSAIWDEIDRQVSLTGLWGSIDPYLDAHPALYTRPSDGRLFLFWSKWNGQFYEIVFASRGLGESWGLLLEVTPQPDSTMDNLQPRAVSDASGRLNVVWIRTSGSGGSVYHAVRFGTSWTSPTRLSGEENARRPVPRVDTQGRTLVDYRTSYEMVTVEVVVVVSAGGSDDIDPTQEGAVDVESHELLREVIVK